MNSSKPDEKEPNFEDLQKILDENAQIIQIIMKSQSEGRMMDCLLYQTRLHLNLVQLASLADNRPHPRIGLKNENKILSNRNKSDEKTKVSVFIQAINENGMRDLDFISKLTSIPIQDVQNLATGFIDHLKRQNRFSEAAKFEEDLEINHRRKTEQEVIIEENSNEQNQINPETEANPNEAKEDNQKNDTPA